MAMARLKEMYRKEILPTLLKEGGYANAMAAPRLEKIVLNVGLGEAVENPNALAAAEKDLSNIAGQHPVTTKARNSIARFKLRKGMPIGLMVTLRGDRMYEFFDKLVNAALPRIRDFRGLSLDSFDGRGNYTMGIREQTIFPEIDYAVDRVRGFQISIATTARTDAEARKLLGLMGLPFSKS